MDKMNNNIIAKIEEALRVQLREEEKDSTLSDNAYKCDRNGKIYEICLSNQHFENFEALSLLFTTLKNLTLIGCTIDNGWAFHALEKLDQLSLENCAVGIDPSIKDKSDFRLARLHLTNISFNSFLSLSAVFYYVYYLKLKHCTIHHISAFLRFDFVSSLFLEEVTFSDEAFSAADDLIANTTHRHFQCLELKNMEILHPAYFLPLAKHLEYVDFTQCRVSNLYEINLFPYLYSLTFDDSDYVGQGNEKHYKADAERRFIFLNFENMNLTDFDFFIPIAESVTILDLYNCEVRSFESIRHFPNLGTLRIHPSLKVEVMEIPTDKNLGLFELEKCEIGPQSIFDWEEVQLLPDFDTEYLATIAPSVKSLKIGGYKLFNTDILKHFTRLEELTFEKCNIALGDFLSVAPQIKSLVFEQTEIKQQEAFKHFTSLEQLKIFTFNDEIGHIDLKNLLPLKAHLKKFDVFYYLIQNIEELKHFNALEELETSVSAIELAQNILSIKSLKKLNLDIDELSPDLEEPVILDLQNLVNLEAINLRAAAGISFKGIGQLQSLEVLDLAFDCDIENLGALKKLKKLTLAGSDLIKVPRLDSVKVLDLTIEEDCEVHSLENFPNLEKLQVSIPYGKKIDLGRLEHLKVLVFENNDFESIVSFDNLPNLEELTLASNNISTLSKLDKLTNLKVLDLEENQIESLEGLEHLKNLECLNLYRNNISDISLLNGLPKLSEVNISGNKIEKQEAEQQLDKPEIIRWLSLPYVPFRVRIK